METDEANVAMDVANVASAQTMSNLEAGVESSSLAPSQVYCPSNNNSPSLKNIVIDLFLYFRLI